MCGCVSVWLPISCPAADMALTLSGYFSTQKPQRKKVAFILYLFSVSSINGVLSSSHADSACGRAEAGWHEIYDIIIAESRLAVMLYCVFRIVRQHGATDF